jgi:peptidoglycan LD-endopeptidase CwlK
MRDQAVSGPLIAQLHPAVRSKVIAAIEATEAKLGPRVACRVVQGFRSIPYQDGLYAIGRTIKGAGAKPGKPMGDTVTNAKGGSSFHNYGLAVDSCLLYDKDGNGTFEAVSWDMTADFNRDGEKDWGEMVAAFKAQGAEWGGDWHSFKDNDHFEWRFGHLENCSDLFALWNAKKFITGTEFVIL